MTGAVLRAGAWPAVAGVSGAAVVVGGCGAAFPAAATVLLPICFALLAAGAVVLLAAALRGQALPWAAAILAVTVVPRFCDRRGNHRAVGALMLLLAMPAAAPRPPGQ